MTILAIASGGFIGAVMRFAIGSFIKSRLQSRFPWATLMVNLSGAFLLGVLLGAGVEGKSYAFFGVGFLGAFTTYSTFMVEALSLRKAGYKRESLIYLAISYSAGLMAAFLGLVLGILYQ